MSIMDGHGPKKVQIEGKGMAQSKSKLDGTGGMLPCSSTIDIKPERFLLFSFFFFFLEGRGRRT
jgi:hypothetical protein